MHSTAPHTSPPRVSAGVARRGARGVASGPFPARAARAAARASPPDDTDGARRAAAGFARQLQAIPRFLPRRRGFFATVVAHVRLDGYKCNNCVSLNTLLPIEAAVAKWLKHRTCNARIPVSTTGDGSLFCSFCLSRVVSGCEAALLRCMDNNRRSAGTHNRVLTVERAKVPVSVAASHGRASAVNAHAAAARSRLPTGAGALRTCSASRQVRKHSGAKIDGCICDGFLGESLP